MQLIGLKIKKNWKMVELIMLLSIHMLLLKPKLGYHQKQKQKQK